VVLSLIGATGTEELLSDALRGAARIIGAVSHIDTDPHGQIDHIFTLARAQDVDVDMPLDLRDSLEARISNMSATRPRGIRTMVGAATPQPISVLASIVNCRLDRAPTDD
jgi:hypothetical protein